MPNEPKGMDGERCIVPEKKLANRCLGMERYMEPQDLRVKWTDSQSRKPGYLFVITSSNQLFSGTGTAIFEWIKHAKKSYSFGIAIDNANIKNFRICKEFCSLEKIPLLASGPAYRRGAADPGVADALEYVRHGSWEIIEVVSWANSATNLDVLAAIREDQTLVYTPHTQPTWTIPGAKRLHLLEPAFEATIRAADIVCCDSPAEVENITKRDEKSQCIYSPLAVDTTRFTPLKSKNRSRQVLLVADFKEKRKRTDLALEAMIRLMRRDPNAMAALAGRGSDEIELTKEFETRFVRHGYVSSEELVRLYQESGVFLLLSDFEAFGIPIAEALSCGTPVVTTRNPEMSSLYKDLAGCALVNNRDEIEIDDAIDKALEWKDHNNISKAAQDRFGLDNAFRSKQKRIQELTRIKRARSKTSGNTVNCRG
jgi:glycosyltransferase involved in cell wall biosynthesis